MLNKTNVNNMNINYKKLKYAITFLLIVVFFGCNTSSEKHLELEAAQISLENNLLSVLSCVY